MAAVAAEACGIDAGVGARGHGGGRAGGRALHRALLRRRAGPAHAGQEPGRLGRAARPGGGIDAPLVVSINARVADGADPSWLWDVPFERLAGRPVVATGDRFRDLSVRLHYAGVAHATEADPARRGRRGSRRRHRRCGRRDRQLHGLPRSARAPAMSRAAARGGGVPRPLGTYGDGGNGLILARRAEWRGLEVELLQAASDRAAARGGHLLPRWRRGRSPGARRAHARSTTGRWPRRVAGGAVVLAVCAGFQVVGRSFPGADGEPHEGVGLLDVETVKGDGAAGGGRGGGRAGRGWRTLPAADRASRTTAA